jgi:hypothetical protein
MGEESTRQLRSMVDRMVGEMVGRTVEVGDPASMRSGHSRLDKGWINGGWVNGGLFPTDRDR